MGGKRTRSKTWHFGIARKIDRRLFCARGSDDSDRKAPSRTVEQESGRASDGRPHLAITTTATATAGSFDTAHWPIDFSFAGRRRQDRQSLFPTKRREGEREVWQQ